jgi:hypothetical protein
MGKKIHYILMRRWMEQFSKTPGGKDFNRMKVQYSMFVDTVVSKQVCVSIVCTSSF